MTIWIGFTLVLLPPTRNMATQHYVLMGTLTVLNFKILAYHFAPLFNIEIKHQVCDRGMIEDEFYNLSYCDSFIVCLRVLRSRINVLGTMMSPLNYSHNICESRCILYSLPFQI
jgi:hypothetical protein